MNSNPTSIILVEDDPATTVYMEGLLTQNGYNVMAYSDADAALAHLANFNSAFPAVVLMDIQMPGEIDGIEAAKIIRARHGLPVIFLTSHDEGDYCKRAMEAEPFAYFVKPFKFDQMRMSIDAAARLGCRTASYHEAKTQVVREFDMGYFSSILLQSKGNLRKALLLSGMHKKNFYVKLRELGLTPGDYK